MSEPVMRMGLIGFQGDQHLSHLLQTHAGVLKWEHGPFVEADALWVNGEHAQLIRNSLVRVPSYDPTKPATLLNLDEMDRPTAFTLPLPSPDIRPPHLFDPYSPPSVQALMAKFEGQLQPLAVELVIGRGIAERRFQLTSAVYHLILRNTLVGVVDLEGDVGLLPGLMPAHAAAASWHGRPPSAHEIPSHFGRTPVSQVMWQYVMRTDEDLLPERYRRTPIYFRGPALVPQNMLRDTHMLLLRELTTGARTFDQLCEQTGLGRKLAGQALAALYFAGSVTSHRRKTAWVPRSKARQGRSDAAPCLSSSLLDSQADFVPPVPDMTIPASLELRQRH